MCTIIKLYLVYLLNSGEEYPSGFSIVLIKINGQQCISYSASVNLIVHKRVCYTLVLAKIGARACSGLKKGTHSLGAQQCKDTKYSD